MKRGPALLLAAACSLGLAACTGIPSSSSPQVIQSFRVGQTPAAGTLTPAPNADQRDIVLGFLAANITQDAHHTAARKFLTPEARNRWSDATTTVVNSSTWEVGNYSAANSTVTVRGQVLGTINPAGIYTPVLQGDGNGGPTTSFSFGVQKDSAGQWRIDSLQPGLLVQSEDFLHTYQARNLYFYDLAGTHLIPDPRYTALADPDLLSNWLVQQLIAGSRPELQSVTASEAAQIDDPQRVVVTVGESITSIEIPGARNLDAATRNYLAGEMAATLEPVAAPHTLQMTDGGRPVTIPAARGTAFTAADFETDDAAVGVPPVFYLRDGVVVDEHGIRLSGAFAIGHHLTSVALARNGQSDLYIAGTTGPADRARLLVGSRKQGLQNTTVRGPLTRPSWAPDVDEVWVGDGAKIWRVATTGTAHPVGFAPTSGVLSGDIVALRLSPDGSRIAIVVEANGGAGQLWVGSIARTASGAVSVVNLTQISPQGIDLFDVAWYGSVQLFAIGQPTAGGVASSFEVQVDGSRWTEHSTIGLPQAPDSVTVAQGGFAWVSAGTTVWEQAGGEWTSPVGNNIGTAPVYLE